MRVITPLPSDCYLACSGGVDSMFALHFMSVSRRKVTPLFFHHGTKDSDAALKFLDQFVPDAIVGIISTDKPKGVSPEEHFRNARYNFFSQYNDRPIITCHHLDDQIETYLMGSMFGKPRLIPYKRGNFIRPFLRVRKSEILDYARKHNVAYIQDQSNFDITIPRNRIRHVVMPEVLKINPGIYKIVSRMMT